MDGKNFFDTFYVQHWSRLCLKIAQFGMYYFFEGIGNLVLLVVIAPQK